MNRLLRTFVTVGLLLCCASFAQAQTTILSNTTLNGAVTASQNTVRLTSVSASANATVGAVVAGQALYVDWEYMTITSISGTVATVIRGQGGTRAAAHATAAVVFSGPTGAYHQTDPTQRSCTIASMGTRPWINQLNGNIWSCVSLLWQASNVANIVYNSNTPY